MFPEPGYESITVSCINSNGKDVNAMSTKLAAEKGYLISAGYGKLKDKTFRIGHMGEWNLARNQRRNCRHRRNLGIIGDHKDPC